MYKIPGETKQFIQANTGDIAGNLYATFNVDLSTNKGKLTTTRAKLVTSQNDVATLDSGIGAFAFFDFNGTGTPQFIALGENVFIGGSDADDAFTLDGSAGSPSGNDQDIYGDMRVFNSDLYVTQGGTNLYKRTFGGAWSTIAGLTGSTSQLMEQFIVTGTPRLYITNGKKILSMNTAGTIATSGDYTISLTTEDFNSISWIRSSGNRIFFGTVGSDSRRTRVYEWDGITENIYSNVYEIAANGTLACVIIDGRPIVLDSNGCLREFNGANFVKFAQFPEEYFPLTSQALSNNNFRFVHPNGMIAVGDNILIFIKSNINADILTGDDFVERFPCGIWEWTRENGLYHKFSPSISQGTVVDYGQFANVIPGALFNAQQRTSGTYDTGNGRFIFGYQANVANSSIGCIGVDETAETRDKSAWIITPEIHTSNISEAWNALAVKYRKLLNSTDKIVVKYRVAKQDPANFACVITSAYSFTASRTATLDSYAVGDEITTLSDEGAGMCAHITNIVQGQSSTTFTIDEAFPVAASTATRIQFQKWRKFGEISGQQKQYDIKNLNEDSPWIQFKVWMKWTGKGELHELLVQNNPASQ